MDYSEDEWRELFAVYRLEVVRAGFGDWDRRACADREDQTAQIAFRRYTRDFVLLLKTLDPDYRKSLIEDLGERVQDVHGRPVSDVRVVLGDGESQSLRELPISGGHAQAFAAFGLELFGDGWNAPDPTEGEDAE